MTRLQAPAGDKRYDLQAWSNYLDHAVGFVDTQTAYEQTCYNKALIKARVNEHIKRENHVQLKRHHLLALVEFLDTERATMIYRRTTPDHPEPFEVQSLSRPTEIAAIAHIVFSVINGSRDAVIDAPYGTLYCTTCGDFHAYHKFYINPDKPRGYDDECRDCINKRYKHLKVA